MSAADIARQFLIDPPIEVSEFTERGNINLDTFLVSAASGRYVLQRVNESVFPLPDRVMAGMTASLSAQRACLLGGHPHAETGWRAMELIPTADGQAYLNGSAAETWRMLSYIEDTVCYKSLNDVPAEHRPFVAREVGRGLAVYSDLTASIDPSAVPISLPGYRDTRIYYNQLRAALGGDVVLPSEPEVREATERHFYGVLPAEEALSRRSDSDLSRFIELALDYEPLAMNLQEARESGEIRTTVIHGDTKIENFLFERETGKVVSLVDLDTVMPLTWLADWGDMVRSLCNPVGEKEQDLSKVIVSDEAYASVLDGFLSTASTATPEEIELMPRAVQAIALELGVRFLADYLRGDTYFALGAGDPADLNKLRAMVQLTLFEKLLKHEEAAKKLIARHALG